MDVEKNSKLFCQKKNSCAQWWPIEKTKKKNGKMFYFFFLTSIKKLFVLIHNFLLKKCTDVVTKR